MWTSTKVTLERHQNSTAFSVFNSGMWLKGYELLDLQWENVWGCVWTSTKVTLRRLQTQLLSVFSTVQCGWKAMSYWSSFEAALLYCRDSSLVLSGKIQVQSLSVHQPGVLSDFLQSWHFNLFFLHSFSRQNQLFGYQYCRSKQQRWRWWYICGLHHERVSGRMHYNSYDIMH